MSDELSPDAYLNMAQTVKRTGDAVREEIIKTQEAGHGVVALFFSNNCKDVEIKILDLPLEDNVRLYPG
jgi:hypothetical protein